MHRETGEAHPGQLGCAEPGCRVLVWNEPAAVGALKVWGQGKIVSAAGFVLVPWASCESLGKQ